MPYCATGVVGICNSLTAKGDDLDYDLAVEENCGKYFWQLKNDESNW